LNDFYFAHPKFAWLLAALFPLAYLFVRPHTTFARRLPIPIAGKKGLFALSWIAMVLALMDPRGGAYYPPKPPVSPLHQSSVTFMIDTSLSMGVEDGRGGLTRLQEAQEIADQTLSFLTGSQAALTTFTAVLVPQTPLTPDLLFVRLVLRHLVLNEGEVGGTSFTPLLKNAYTTPLVIVFSDGGDTGLENLQGEPRQVALTAFETLAKQQKSRLITVGVGSEKGGPVPLLPERVISTLHSDALKAISTYFEASSQSTHALAETLAREIQGGNLLNEEAPSLAYRRYFQIPLLIALALLLLTRWIPTAVLPLLVSSIYAVSPATFYEAGDFATARTLYREQLRGARSDWERMALTYNLALTELRMGENQEALETLDRFRLDPEDPSFLHHAFSFARAVALYHLESYQEALDEISTIPQQEAFRDSILLQRGALPRPISTDPLQTLLWQFADAEGAVEKEKKVLESQPLSLPFYEAWFQTQRRFWKSQTATPLSLLEELIVEQRIVRHAPQLQSEVNTLAATYLPLVWITQQTHFEKGACQKSPWEASLPPFEKGLQAALFGDSQWALRDWQESLRLLKNPPPESAPPPLQEIVDMESDDRPPPSQARPQGGKMEW